MHKLLILKNIVAEKCNGKTGDFIYGFPSISSFLGACHNIERHIKNNTNLKFFNFDGVVIISHYSKCIANSDRDYGDLSFHQPRFPLGKNGSPLSLVNEVYADIKVSLIVGININDEEFNRYKGNDKSESSILEELSREAEKYLKILKFCSGFVSSVDKVLAVEDDAFLDWMRYLSPGYVLRNRSDLLVNRSNDEDCLSFIFNSTRKTFSWNNVKAAWRSYREFDTTLLVPIEIGFIEIESIDEENVCDKRSNLNETKLVESLYSIGEWIKPYKIKSLDSVCWKYVNKNPLFLFADDFDSKDKSNQCNCICSGE